MSPSCSLPSETPEKRSLSPVKALRQTLNFAMKMGSAVITRRPPKFDDSGKFMCKFEDEVVKIPGCHGNSVIKFEIFDGE